MNLQVKVLDSDGILLGKGGDYPWDIQPETKQQMFGIPIYKDLMKFIPLNKNDISGPVKLEIILIEK